MKTQIKDKILAVRLCQGESVVDSLNKAVSQAGCSLGVVINGAGMMKNVKLGYFIGKGRYKEHYIPEPREIVSLAGNFVNCEDGFFTHLHVSLADDDFKVRGGHLEEAVVHGTGEFFVLLTDIRAGRELEEETGLKGLIL